MSTQKSSSPKRFPKRKTLVLALSAVIPLVVSAGTVSSHSIGGF